MKDMTLVTDSQGIPSIPTLDWERFELPNGLSVVVHEDHREPRVHVGMNYRVGSKDETVGVNTGFAHLFEHVMFGGTERLPGPYMDRLKAAGALEVNGETSHDSTRFYQLVHTGMLEFTLYAEADRMAHLGTQLRQEVLDQQRQIVLMEKRQREGEAMGLVSACVSRGLFPTGHPYRHTVIGEEADLRAATLEAAQAWSVRHYAPSNAVLVLVGDVTVEQARAMVARQFGHIPPGPPLFRPGPWVEPLSARRRDQLDDPLVSDAFLHFVWVSPEAADGRADAIGLALRLLTEGSPSLLAKTLVRDGGSVRDVSAHALSEASCGQVSVTLRLAPGADAEAAECEFRAALAQMFEAPLDALRLEQLVRQQLHDLAQACNALSGKAAVLTSGALLFDDPGAFSRVAKRWLQLRADEVRAAAVQCFSAEPYVLQVRPCIHAMFAGTGAGPEQAPAVTSTAGRPATLHARRLQAGAQVPLWHAPGPDPQRLSLRLVIDRGLVDLPAQAKSLALLLTALPRLGLGGRDAQAQAAWLAASGLRLSCRCDSDTFNLQVDGPANAAPQAVELLGDLVSWSTQATAEQDAGFAFERQQALMHWQAGRADPLATAALLPQLALLGHGHPLNLTPDLAIRSLEAATLNGLRALHRQLFDPRLATLVIVGEVDATAFCAQLDRVWSAWSAPQGAPLPRMTSPCVPERGATAPVELIEAGQAGQAQLFGACLLPPFKPAEEWVWTALVHILGGDIQSRLSRQLRDRLNLTYGVHAGIDGTDRPDMPRLLIVHSAMDPARAAVGLQEVQRVLGALSDEEPPTADEVDAFKRSMALRLPSFAREPAEVCEALAFQCRTGLDGSYWSERAQALQQLSPADVQVMARSLLRGAGFCWSLAGDARALAGQLAIHGLQDRTPMIGEGLLSSAAATADMALTDAS